jgi:uncharacterized RDD family membrane protein YckC
MQKTLRVAKLARFIAKAIDLFLAMLLSFFFYPLGIILACIYISISDSIQNGQSVGKKLIGFKVISLIDGTPCTLRQSLVRNLPFLIPLFVAIIPLWGWVISILLGLPLIGFEIYLLVKLDSGHRMGDVMADTSVMANDGMQQLAKVKRTSWFASEKSPTL